MHIDSLTLRTIYNSRVQPTVEADINGYQAAAPSGASTGSHESHCHVPDDLEQVEAELQAVLVGSDLDQDELDAQLREVDGTGNFKQIGAAAIATSLAYWKAADHAVPEQPTFPYPVGNLVGGGAHGGNTTIQEFLIVPTGAETMPDAMATLSTVYNAFRDKYSSKIRGLNDEGAFITGMSDEETLEAVATIAEDHGCALGVDMAASEYYNADKEQYEYGSMAMALDAHQQSKFVQNLIDQFGLVYVEDPFHEDDYESFSDLTEQTQDTLIVGDDLFVTNKERLEHGAAVGAGNSLIIKPNQVGTVTAARETVDFAEEHGYTPVVSHRSGETCDPVIADLAVHWRVPLVKFGIGGVRTAKNNQLLRLWDEYDGTMAELPF